MNNQREALKRAFIALYRMLIDFDISPGVAIDPPKRYPLTEEQIEAISKAIERSDFFDCVVPFARAIERAHGIGDD